MVKIPLLEGIRYNEGMMSEQNPERAIESERTLQVLLSVVTTLLVLGALGLFIYYFYALTSLLVIVLIVTYILLGPVNLMEYGIRFISQRLNRLPGYQNLLGKTPEANPRILAVLIVYLVFFLTLVFSGIQFAPILSKQMGEMGSRIGAQVAHASDEAIDWADHHIGRGVFRSFFAKDIDQAQRQGLVKTPAQADNSITQEEKQVIHQSLLQNTITQLENALASALPNFISFVGGTVNGILYFLVGLLLTFYFLVDGGKLKSEWLCLVPPQARPTLNSFLRSVHQVMFAFIKGQVMLGLLTGAYMFAIYSIFHVPYAFLLGCIFAIAELLPVVGTWIGIIIGLTVILLNMDPIVALWVWLCSYGYQTIKDNILAPKVVGDVMGLHPLVIILALLICAQVAGLLGVLVALPLASIVNVIIRLLLQRDQEQKQARGEVANG